MQHRSIQAAGVLLAFVLASATAVAGAKQTAFGQLADGSKVEAVELSNGRGMTARVITLGATLQSLVVPDRNGRQADVVLGYSSAAEYITNPQFFGVTVGRYANRIAGAQFTLDGRRYKLETNDGANHLHGGSRGFDKAIWRIESVKDASPAQVVLSHVSPDGDSGYPGTLKLTATYSLSDANDLTVEYKATADKPTVVSLTNHSYFNLAGEASGAPVLDHRLTLYADHYTPVDRTLIPTGELRKVEGTPFDFRNPQLLGERIRDARDEQIRFGRGYDHNFVINGAAGTLRPAARVEDPKTGRVMELLTSAPAVQLYSANHLNGTVTGKGGVLYRQSDSFCLEPQAFPDAPNQPKFPSARLNPGETYSNTIVYRFPGRD